MTWSVISTKKGTSDMNVISTKKGTSNMSMISTEKGTSVSSLAVTFVARCVGMIRFGMILSINVLFDIYAG